MSFMSCTLPLQTYVDDDDDDDAVTYSTVKAPPPPSAAAASSADVSDLYATINKPNQ